MGPTSAIVLYVVVWFLVMFITLPIGRRTQGDDNDIFPGTQAGAPSNFNLKRTIWIVSGVTLVIWTILVAVILSGVFSIRDLGWI